MNRSSAEALLALGGNLGDVRATFERAIAMLCADGAMRLVARSSDYRTPPWGVTDQPAFINAAIIVATSLEPHALLGRVRNVECALGRDRASERRWGPRPIDIDILAYDDVALREPDLTVPHPRLFERAFVLLPLAEIAADRVIAGRRVGDALAALDVSGIAKLPPVGRRLVAWHFADMANPKVPSETPLLASDFPSATEADWRKLVDAVLKGGSFERLKSRTYDGLTIEPLYSSAREESIIAARPGGTAWAVMQRVDHPDPAAANVQAREDLDGGATGLVLVFAGSMSANGFGLEANSAGLASVFEGIDPRGIVLDLNLSPATRGMAREVATLIKNRGIAPSAIDLRFSINPIGGFAAAGRSAQGWQELAPAFAAMIAALAGDGFRGPFAVADGRVIHNAGGSEAQELAFALASAVTYLRALEQSGMALQAAYDAIYFRLAADADQFMTTAKFRALRKLWARVATAAGLSPKPTIVTAETGWRILTRRDAYGNILRSTIAVAAAGLGGADAITVLPHTAALGLPDAFARRVARNMQLILLQESNLARVADPAAGSGAFEALTEQLCLAAWTQFQEIERAGGAWRSLESGLMQRNVAAVRATRQQALARGKEILTGTNAYPDIAETPPAVLDVAPRVTVSDEPAAITAPSLPRLRLAEPFEALRDKSDRILAATGVRPKVFLATLGAPAQFTARANFAMNFFEAGGIQALSGTPSDYRAAQAAIACLCPSSKASEQELASAAAAIKRSGARHIYFTGRVAAQEDMLRAAGVQTFIDEGSDALATLNAAYDILQQRITEP